MMYEVVYIYLVSYLYKLKETYGTLRETYKRYRE